jgi:electron transfer flavoprotein alpha subunit
MPILIFLDHADGQVKKASLEAICYGAKIAEQIGQQAEAVLLGTVDQDLAALGAYGIQKVYQVPDEQLNHLDSQVYCHMLAEITKQTEAKLVVFANNLSGKSVAPRLSVRLGAALVSGAVALPITSSGFLVKKNVFSGKAFAMVSLNTPIKIIALNPNSFPITHGEGKAEVKTLTLAPEIARVKVLTQTKSSGEIPLTEAEIVISGGRGLKGPENWGMIEELAKLLHAATACSRPVADAHWRPHNEHVGQTGIAIAPNLYVAIGISGAIQHLAGVNRSKVIVVINKDPEAPFFKAADYGIVGDAFEVVPKMIEAVKKLKGIS